jgi:fused signal recognition particle receptor
MELLIGAVLLGVLLVVVLVVFVTSGRRHGPGLDAQTQDVLEERAPTVDRAPEGLEGVEPPQPVDLEELGGAVEAPEAPTAVPAPVEEPPAPPAPPALTASQRFWLRLGRARGVLGSNVVAIFRGGLDDEAFDELEESLIAADVGVEATLELVQGLRRRVREEGIRTGEGALALLKEILRLELSVADRRLRRRESGTTVWLITGVNGTGKTTSIGKIAARHIGAGEQVVLAAGDTFRAAASEQLELWGERAGARVVHHAPGADPAAVAFDGYQAARAASADLLLVDTAGRLQNKSALMAELQKVKRVLEREGGPCDEVLLVLDATTGQNGLAQAKAFLEAVDITGVILTKLDGTAKGGIVIAIQRQLGIPVKLVGLGESIEDLAEFDPDAFVDALFAEGVQEVEADDASSGAPGAVRADSREA